MLRRKLKDLPEELEDLVYEFVLGSTEYRRQYYQIVMAAIMELVDIRQQYALMRFSLLNVLDRFMELGILVSWVDVHTTYAKKNYKQDNYIILRWHSKLRAPSTIAICYINDRWVYCSLAHLTRHHETISTFAQDIVCSIHNRYHM